jgi:hypothetical protein
MKTILGIILIVAGIALFIQGWNRKDSIAGQAAQTGTQIANSIDGGTRTPKHVGYMVGGAVLVVAGAAIMARRGSRSV